MRRAYQNKKFGSVKLEMIARVNAILQDFGSQGFDLTARQIYYQFVANKWFPSDRTWTQIPGTNKWRRDPNGTVNAEPNYKWLCDIISDGRMAGRIDWSSVVDRTRRVNRMPTWDTPAELMEDATAQFANDLWASQPYYVEVWVEKEALAGVVERPSREHRCPFFSCRGYASQSAMWGAAQRLGRIMRDGRKVRILYLGDHDPSGVDMTRDIRERLELFLATDYFADDKDVDSSEAWQFVDDFFSVERIALTMEQVRMYDPPPDPAKLSDSRARAYIERYGERAWELDALSPAVLAGLIEEAVDRVLDHDAWDEAESVESEHQRKLDLVVNNWSEITEGL